MTTQPWGSLRPRGLSAVCISALRHRILRGAPTKRAVYRLMERLGPFYDIEIGDLRLRCRVNDNATETLAIIYGLRRGIEVAQIIGNLKTGDTFVDVGANSGLFALHAAKAVGPAGTVLAIEPNPAMLERLRFNIEANGFTNVEVAGVAIGDTSGKATLHIVSKQHGRSSMHPVPGGNTLLTVPLEPLLSVLSSRRIDKICAMKIDIEGFEDRALIPFYETAPERLWPQHILIEILARHQFWQRDCLSYLLDLGYKVAWQGEADTLLARKAS